jgi:hypothetical protein
VQKLRLYCKESFLDYISGGFGEHVILDFMSILQVKALRSSSSALGLSACFAKLLFTQVLAGMADTWRRFCFEYQTYPYVMFALVDVEESVFWSRASKMISELRACESCVDKIFSTPILEELFAAIADPDPERRRRTYVKISSFLGEHTVCSPITSDMVEVLHGQLQHRLHGNHRGRYKEAVASEERSFLGSVNSEFHSIWEFVRDECMPSKTVVAAVLRPSPKAAMKAKAIGEFAKEKEPARKVRKLCGWNLFQS